MKNSLVVLAAAVILPAVCPAVSTHSWVTSSYADFEKAELERVSLRSDGRITLAPKTSEIFDSGLGYIWALARDSKGAIYAAGGPGARVYRFSGGKVEKVAEFESVDVHAIAIDAKDRVFVSTFPDSRIYRLEPNSKPIEFYDPHRKYIWSLLFDRHGNLLVGTGETGEVHRVTSEGKGTVFFRSEDTHIRSMALSGEDLIVGTDPGGLVIRIDAKGEGFVVYQLPKREVTAVAVSKDGSIYAAGAGAQQASGAGSLLSTLTASPAPTAPLAPGGPPKPAAGAPGPPPAPLPRAPQLSGGSEVYRIEPGGLPSRVWASSRDVAYALAFDSAGMPIVGTGNKGILYRIDSPALNTELSHLDVNQITALVPLPDGGLLAATANVGKVFQSGPARETQGVVTSDVFDSDSFTQWGRDTAFGDLPIGTVKLEARSGNLDRPRQFWSPWSSSAPPPARFVQWRATLTGSAASPGPTVDAVELAYLSRNAAPHLDEIESTPPNYRFTTPLAQVLQSRTPGNINLPAIGRRNSASTAVSLDLDASSMSFAKGWIGVRWSASDPNGDPMLYTVQIRGEHETTWKPLHDRLSERHYSFDSTAFPDGEYRFRLTATDQPGNVAGEALSAELDSSPVLIDNTPPTVTSLTGRRAGSVLHLAWKAADALSVIKTAEYSVDGDEWMLVNPVSRVSDSLALDYTLALDAVSPGEHTIAVRVTDDYDNTATQKIVISK